MLQVPLVVMERLVRPQRNAVVGRHRLVNVTIVHRLRLIRIIIPVLIVGILFLMIQIRVDMVILG